MHRIVFSLLSIISFISSIYISINNIHAGYNYIFILPLVYGFFSIFMAIINNKNLIINLIYAVYFIRFTLLNVMVVYSGWYEGRAYYSPLYASYNIGTFLMLMEFVIINICYIIFLKKYDLNLQKDTLNLKFNDSTRDFVYIIFIIFSILLTPFIRSQISFLGIGWSNPNTSMNQLQVLLFFSMYVSKYLMLGLIIKYFYIKYSKTQNDFFIFSTFILVLILNSIFIGTNRMDFILPFIASLVLLTYLYKRKMIIYNILSAFFLVSALYVISLFRNTFDFQISTDTSSVITDNIQVYFGGLYNVALSLEIDLVSNQNPIITLLYDLVRSFLGLNLFWRSDTLYTSSELFNQRIFGYDHVSQIIPLLGQFYNAFGISGVIISMLMFSLLMFIFLKLLKGSYIITTLIILVLIIRLILSPVQNLSIFINEFSSIVLIFVTLNIISWFIKITVKNKKEKSI